MKLRLILLFIKWIFVGIFKQISERNKKFRKMLARETGFGIFAWFIGSTLFGAVFILVSAMFVETLAGMSMVLMIYLGLIFSYLVYHGISVLFENFIDERQKLFRDLKDY